MRQVENMRFFEPHILSAVSLEMVCKRHRECAVRRAAYSLSCFIGDGRQEAENVRFFEPQILYALAWEIICDRERECAAL